jgi:hypothetical protein
MHPTPPIPDDEISPSGMKKLAIESVSQLVEDYPLLFWAGIWLSVLLVAAIAVSGLVSPGLPGRRASSASFGSSTSSENVQTSGRQNRVPFWLFGALAITCTAGSILVSQRISQTERTHKLSRPRRSGQHSPSVPRSANVGHRPSAHGKRPGKRLRPFVENEFRSPPTPPISRPQPSGTSFGSLNPRRQGKRRPQPISRKGADPVPVTVIPPEQNHRLDWNEASLADVMDIRKQRSLSSWM